MTEPITYVIWYCHSCGRSHRHTIAQRDHHRDMLMQAEAARIDRAARLKEVRQRESQSYSTPTSSS